MTETAISARTPSIEVDMDALETDPYPAYARWRRESPVAWSPAMDSWLVSTWDDCERIGKDDRVCGVDGAEFFGPNLLGLEGDPHRYLRGAVDAPLRPKAVASYVRTLATPITERYVEDLRPRGRADLTTELLELLSVRIVGDVMGMAGVDDLVLQRWFQDLSAGMTNFADDAEVATLSDTAMTEVDDFFFSAYDRLRTDPDGTSFAHLITSNTPDGEPRRAEDLIGTVRMMLLGGLQEPGHAAAASLFGLLDDPAQYDAVRADPALVPAAIHEGLRWIAPFGTTARRATADIEIGDARIRQGDMINLVIASANHDETRYERPETFDISRPRQPVASFGYGAHFCAGHFLGREIERIALETITRALPGLRLDPVRPARVHGFGVRGVKSLPVVWDV